MVEAEERVENQDALPWGHLPLVESLDAGAVPVIVDKLPDLQFARGVVRRYLGGMQDPFRGGGVLHDEIAVDQLSAPRAFDVRRLRAHADAERRILSVGQYRQRRRTRAGISWREYTAVGSPAGRSYLRH